MDDRRHPSTDFSSGISAGSRFPGRARGLVLLGAAALALLASGAAPSRAQAPATVDAVYPAKERGEVEIQVSAGTIRVIGEARRDIAVSGRLGSDVAAWDVFHEGRFARFHAVPPGGVADGSLDLAVDLELRIPLGNSVRLQSMEGRNLIENVTGTVTVSAATAEIIVRGAPRRVDVTTVSGPIEVEIESPDAVLKSVSGPIDVGGRIEHLIAETVDTELRVEAAIRTEALLRSVVGEVRFDGELEETARLKVETSSADAYVRLPAKPTGSFRVETSGGALHGRLGDEDVPALRAERGRRISAWTRGDAPRQVAVRTVDGDIHLQTGALPSPE